LDLSAIQKFLEDKKVLVTGAGGSIGSELCRQIVEYSPKTLFLLDKGENYLHEIRCELDGQFTSVQIRSNLCNITNSAKMTRIFEEYHPEIIFHAAAHKHVPLSEENPEEAIWNNVYGTKVLANLADEFGVREFVMISTDKAINPSSLMGVTKRIAELYIQALSQKKATKTKFVTVRFGNVLNSNGSVVPIFKNQIEKGGPITITHPDVSRYFMSIAEAAQLVLQAGTMGKSGEIFLLEMGKSIRILDLAIELINQAGLKPFEDIPVKIIGLRPGEKMHEELIGRDEVASPTSHVGIKILQSKQVVTLTEIEAKIAELINFDYSRGFNILTKKIIDLVSEYQPSNPQANPQIKADNVNKLEFEISHLNSSKNVAFSARGNNR
jgi:FlaA1/EpsC-like NDP-sugar epimerase